MKSVLSVYDTVGEGIVLLIGLSDAFCTGDAVMAVVAQIDIVFEDAVRRTDDRLCPEPVQGGGFRQENLAAVRYDQQVRLDVAEAVADQFIEAVVHGQDNDQGGGADGHADGADRGDDVDHIV